MSNSPNVDYDALAKRYGALLPDAMTPRIGGSPAPPIGNVEKGAIDYDALAKQHGAISSTPESGSYMQRQNALIDQMLRETGQGQQEGLYSGMARRLVGSSQPFTDLANIVAHPIEAAKQVPGAVANIPENLGAQEQLNALANVPKAAKAGNYGDMVGSTLEGLIPIGGPLAARIGSGLGIASVTGNFNEPMRDVAALGYAGLAGKVLPDAGAAVKGKVASFLSPNEAKVAESRASNLASALEMGGKAAKSTLTYEDVAQPILNDFRAEAAKQGIQVKDFSGRNGYGAAKSITQGVRTSYNNAYESLIDPIRGQPASLAAQTAAKDVIGKMGSDAQLLDELSKSGNVQKLNELAQRVGQAKTIGELDDLRIALNRLSAKYEARPEAGQYQSPLFQESLSSAADSIRNSLYSDVAKRYQGVLSEADLRQLQLSHGAAIEADQLMQNTASAISRAASTEASPPTISQRLRGSAYRATMSPRHAVGGMIERMFPPSDVELFNARMQRVLEGASPTEGNVLPSLAPPAQKMLPRGPIELGPPPDASQVSVSSQPYESIFPVQQKRLTAGTPAGNRLQPNIGDIYSAPVKEVQSGPVDLFQAPRDVMLRRNGLWYNRRTGKIERLP